MKRLLTLAALLLLTTSTAWAGASDPWVSWPKGIPAKDYTHFSQLWASSPKVRLECGKPAGPEWKGRHGVWHQRFRHCEMSQAPVRVQRLSRPHAPSSATPRPVQTATPGRYPATATPAAPQASPTPVGQPFSVGPVGPTVTPVPSSDPDHYLLNLINQERQQVGSAPLTLDSQLSACALAHSKRMASEGGISHDGFPSPDLQGCITGWTTGGQNVGYAGGDEISAIKMDFDQMMSEGHTPLGTCQDGHDCDITQRNFTRVGIGIYDNGYTWVTETFANG